MRTFNNYKKVLIAITFYDHTYDDRRPRSLFHSNLSHAKLLLRFFRLISAIPLSLLAWALLRILSIRYKVSIYVLKTFRPGFASTYLCMMEPLCRQIQHENKSRHIKILVDPGESVSNVLTKSYAPHFALYLDDRRKFLRQICYLIPKSGLEKRFINTSDKFLPSWLYMPSKNYADLKSPIPSDLKNLGIETGNFVLFAHASQNYYQSRLPSEYLSEMKHMFYDLASYGPALNKLAENNLKVVRVGLDVDELPMTLKKMAIIDYTGEIRNEESEFWLYENCKFLLSAANGAFWFARRFDRPTLITNSYVLPLGYFSTYYTPRTFRSNESGKLLTFAEILEIRSSPNFLSNQFMKDHKLELLPNSSLTIVNAVNELIELSTEQKKLTQEDHQLLKRYEAILNSFKIPIVEKMTMPTVSFLREYSQLL